MRVSSIYKAPKGLIRVSADVDKNFIRDVRITGDFFMIPEESLPILEGKLLGKRLEVGELGRAIDEFYLLGVQTPGLSRDDIVKALLGVADGR